METMEESVEIPPSLVTVMPSPMTTFISSPIPVLKSSASAIQNLASPVAVGFILKDAEKRMIGSSV